MATIVFTGGGTAGHVNPAIALFSDLQKKGWDIRYIGSYNGIERKLITDLNIPYYPISTGKLRRYFDFKNFTDPFRVTRGILQARKILKRIRPKLIFSKGGFVPVPVVIAAKQLKIPIILHESDLTPGLANKIALRYADKIFTTFPETAQYLKKYNAVYTGTPIRQEILNGDQDSGLKLCGFTKDKPIIMVMGGSSGSKAINDCVREILPELLTQFQLIHLCGKGHLDNSLENTKGYAQFEYINEAMPHVFAIADMLVARAGANTLFEVLQLKLPNLLIPLSKKVSRGDQIENAQSFKDQGFSLVLQEEDMNPNTLLMNIYDLNEHKNDYINKMNQAPVSNSNLNIIDAINQYK
ncbi:undecaprenyldiphospho-muramoylpentapeptide beta-N-acetylglucosaminyltransferase [Clostridium sp. 'deep sea']|uniref:undecaprenyldiphospho-muramoylpentapeptide beta-N-acetylglucosaminyltransferase n=1 Tax=Clostridium sp. 'deep sea' TaxID=2779445 RepID=UPI0018964FD2|nr:undecaprenyldiphospho-muramoylpentapeptide beta-N-acetylglucosaminyltransferase [Clostridium sp. 'deep sea']QOR34397.1 undecaprenyldiphospho-muramoylpentapeptide beta-N-acetylglucosaminyltransferase [Clostridium sp. 'deep sea']